MSNKLMKVNEETHRAIQNISAKTDDNMIQVIEKAIKLYEKKLFWKEFNDSFKRLSKEELQEYYRETESMNGTLKDGLDD